VTPADLWALADRPAPPIIPGQTAVDDPRPVVPAGEPEPLFDPAVYARALADVRALRPYGTYQTKAKKLPSVERPECGTRAGYRKHQKHGETTCYSCRGANAAADRALRAGRTT
jgi:hypothetical protein